MTSIVVVVKLRPKIWQIESHRTQHMSWHRVLADIEAETEPCASKRLVCHVTWWHDVEADLGWPTTEV